MGDLEENIRKIILQNYPSVKDFALKSGVPYSTVRYALNKGILKTSAENLFTIGKLLHIDFNALANGSVSPVLDYNVDPSDVRFFEILSILKQMNESQLQEVSNYSKYLASCSLKPTEVF